MTFNHRLGNGDSHVLVLHGWLGPAASWLPVQAHLDTDHFTYAFLDYRGYGDRRGETGTYSMDEIAGDALALVDSLGWDRFSIVGHSMGGMAMQKVLALAPERVQALFGVSPVPASGVPFDDATWGLFASAADAPHSRRAIIDFTTGGGLPARWLDATVARSVATSDPKAVSGYLQAWAKSDFVADITGSPVPVQVVAGGNDPAISADVLRATFGTWYPNCEVKELPGVGHYAPDELPVALAGLIEAHLRSAG